MTKLKWRKNQHAWRLVDSTVPDIAQYELVPVWEFDHIDRWILTERYKLDIGHYYGFRQIAVFYNRYANPGKLRREILEVLSED